MEDQFASDPQKMEECMTRLKETSRVLLAEAFDWAPDPDPLPQKVKENFLFMSIDRSIFCLQILSGCSSFLCSEAVHEVYEQEHRDAFVGRLEQQFEKEEE